MADVDMEDESTLTELARKYAHPEGDQHNIIKDTGKSGLTPLTPLDESFLTEVEKQKRLQFEVYQRKRCLGFTVSELVALEAFAPLYDGYKDENRAPVMRPQKMTEAHHAVQNELPRERVENHEPTMPFHPIYERKNWTRDLPINRARYPLDEKPGEWGACEDEVWEALKPCVQLASQFLNNANKFPWWEVFLTESQWTEVKSDRISEEDRRLYNDTTRSKLWNAVPLPHETARSPSMIDAVKRNLLSLAGQIEFDITSCKIEPLTGIVRPHGKAYGEATEYEHNRKPVVFIPLEMIAPLLREDHNAAERNLDIFRVAQTLLHETCHAIYNLSKQKNRVSSHQPEPYFDEEPLCEVGYSMETSIWGGYSRFLIDEFPPDFKFGTEFSCAAIFRGNWFNKSHVGYVRDAPTLGNPLPYDWEYQDVYPIPVAYFEDIRYSEFWLNHGRYGQDAMEMGPLVWGLRTKLPDGQLGPRQWNPDDADFTTEAFAQGPAEEPSPEELNFDEDGQEVVVSQAMVEMEKRRRVRQRRIYNKMCLVKGRLDGQASGAVVQGPSQVSAPSINTNQPRGSHLSPSRIPSGNDHSGRPQQGIPTAISSNCNLDNDGTADVEMTEPPSARYEQIRAFLLTNRSQGLLCLDSLPHLSHNSPSFHGRSYPEHLLLHHILEYGGLSITPYEWTEFLQIATERSELFLWDPAGRGQLFWIEPKDPQVPWKPSPIGVSKLKPTVYWAEAVQALCEYEDWMEDYPIDWDPQFLQWKLNQARYKWRGGDCPITFMDNKKNQIVAFIDYWDRVGMYWCWGPNRTARRLLGQWKKRPLYHDEGDIFDFPETKPKIPKKPPKKTPAVDTTPTVEVPKEPYQIWWDLNYGNAERTRSSEPSRRRGWCS